MKITCARRSAIKNSTIGATYEVRKVEEAGSWETLLTGSRSSDFILQDMKNHQRTSDTGTAQPQLTCISNGPFSGVWEGTISGGQDWR